MTPRRTVFDFSPVFLISADIIEFTKSIAIEVKTSPMVKHSWVPVAVGNAVWTCGHDFRFDLCVTAHEDFRNRDEVIRALRRYGVQPFWAMVDVDHAGDI